MPDKKRTPGLRSAYDETIERLRSEKEINPTPPPFGDKDKFLKELAEFEEELDVKCQMEAARAWQSLRNIIILR